MKKIYILDSSAILSGKPLYLEGKIVIPESIEREVAREDPKLLQIFLGRDIRYEKPSKKSLDEVNRVAENLGEKERLSDVDKEIIALALDYRREGDVCIITDDYSIQNVSSFLGLKYRGISERGISEKFEWGYRCEGCKKFFKRPLSSCPVCGSKLKPVVKKKTKV